MKIIKEKKIKLKTYVVEYWFLVFIDGEDMGYDFNQVEVQAISPSSAIRKVKDNAQHDFPHALNAKNFKVVRYFRN